MAIRDVGAFPTTKIVSPSSFDAFSTDTAARVMPLSDASFATSSSAIKQYALMPNLFNTLLFMPARAIFVSVTILAPFFSFSMKMSTAFSEKTRLSA